MRRCDGCGRLNEADMLFCLQCGQNLALPSVAGKQTNTVLPCLACGKVDSLSERFCIHCGQQMNAKVSPLATLTVESPPLRHKRIWFSPIVWAAAGLLVGVLVANSIPFAWLEYRIAQQHWPAHGLVVYTKLSDGQYVLQQDTGKNFTLGRIAPDGSFCVPDLAPGNYQLTISHPGFQSNVQNLQINSQQATVVGFPLRIQLASKKSAAEES